MRFLLLAASLASVIAACGEAPRSFTGKAERGTTAVLAVDEAGNNFRAEPGSDGSFELPVASLTDLSFYVLKTDGTSQSVIFQNPDGSGLTTIVPPSSGIVSFGDLSTDVLDNLLADSSKDPLSQIDFANASSSGTATAQSNGGGGGGGGSAGSGHKTTICHSTNSAHNPFVKITVDNHALPAHRKHHNGRDIIPAPAEGCPAGGSGGSGGGASSGNGHGNGNGGGNGHGHGGGGAGGVDGGEGEGEGEGEGGAACPPNTEGCTPPGSTGSTGGTGSGSTGTGSTGTGSTGTGSTGTGSTGEGSGGGTTGTGGTGTGTTGGGEGEGEGEGAAPEIPPLPPSG
jgi:hypothetical protein